MSKSESRDAKAFLKTALDRFQLAADAEAKIREEALEDMRFRAGEQWPAQIRSARDLDKRPCLTINRLPQFLKTVSNEQRQNRPSIQVNPVGAGADEATAEVIQGIVRHIELNSHADVAYDTAFESAATGGFGYFRFVTEYQDDQSFDQEIFIKRIRNPFTVYFDPSCQMPDYSDANWAFVVEDMAPEDFKEQYPDAAAVGFEGLSSVGDAPAGWLSKGNVRVAEYFRISRKKQTIVLLADGTTCPVDEVPEHAEVKLDKDGEPIERETEIPTVKWAKITALDILEEQDWPGKYIPIVPVLGDEIDIDGERQLVSLIRYARDPQRMYNYWVSAQTEMIALAPRAPYIGAEGQFEGHEAQWKAANVRNLPYLEYKPKSVSGGLAPAPARQPFEPPIQAITAAIAQSANDLKSTMGIYDASLGAPGPEQSGKAILARQKEGDTATLHFTDNLTRSIKHAGRILIDLIPKIYDAPRVLRIIGDDKQQKTVQINMPFIEAGIQKLYDLSTGRYDVNVSVGPSYDSKRQEAVESIMALTQAYPPLMQAAGDLLVENMDWPGATEIAERLKKLLPPALQDNPQGQNDPRLGAAQAQIQKLTATLQALNQEREAKVVENASKERIAAMQIASKEKLQAWQTQATLVTALVQANSADAQQRADLEYDRLNSMFGAAHEAGMASMNHAHDLAQAEQQHQQQLQQAQQSQGAQAAQQQNAQQFQAQQAAEAREAAAAQQQQQTPEAA